MTTRAFRSAQYEVDNVAEAVEFYFEKGWTDGLPVVPPTEENVSGPYWVLRSDRMSSLPRNHPIRVCTSGRRPGYARDLQPLALRRGHEHCIQIHLQPRGERNRCDYSGAVDNRPAETAKAQSFNEIAGRAAARWFNLCLYPEIAPAYKDVVVSMSGTNNAPEVVGFYRCWTKKAPLPAVSRVSSRSCRWRGCTPAGTVFRTCLLSVDLSPAASRSRSRTVA